MKIKFEAELDTKEDDELGLLLVELLQKLKKRLICIGQFNNFRII